MYDLADKIIGELQAAEPAKHGDALSVVTGVSAVGA